MEASKYDLSVCIPAIRPHWWKRFYDSLNRSCKRHKFELVMVSPFDLPPELEGAENIKVIHDMGSPARATQIGALHCEAPLMYIPVDDAIAFDDAIDIALDQYHRICSNKDVINCAYREGANFSGQQRPEGYWHFRWHDDVNHFRFNPDWMWSMQPMLSVEYFKEIGGLDCCTFESLCWALHDLCVRIHKDGGQFHLSEVDVMNTDWFGAWGYDHGPVQQAVDIDTPKFAQMYSNPANDNRIKIDFDNWKQSPERFAKRFGG